MTPLQERQSRINEKLRREFGANVCDLLADTDVIEVMANPDGRVWTDRLSVGMVDSGIHLTTAQIELAIGTVAALQINMVANHGYPLVKAELPNGERFQGMMRPVAQPSFVIRKHLPRVFTLAEQVGAGTLTVEQAGILTDSIRNRLNVAIGGATLSGKTVLADSLMHAMCEMFGPTLRLVLIEDTYELHCPSENAIHLHTTNSQDLRSLVQTTMRLRPDRIIVGEVRGAEALDFVKALATGHPGGITTVHANSATQVLDRLESLIEEAGVQPNRRTLASTINIVVMMEREDSRHWKVKEIVECRGWDNQAQVYQFGTIQPTGGSYAQEVTKPYHNGHALSA